MGRVKDILDKAPLQDAKNLGYKEGDKVMLMIPGVIEESGGIKVFVNGGKTWGVFTVDDPKMLKKRK